MNCPECLERMQEQLDGVVIADRSALDAHLADCADCRAWFAASHYLMQGLRALPAPSLPLNLTERVVIAVLAGQRRCRMRRWLAAGAAVAAAIVLATLIGFPRSSPPGPAPAPEARRPQPKQEEKRSEKLEAPAAPTLGQSVAEAQSAVAALTGDLAARTRSQAQLLWPTQTPTFPGVEELQQPLGPAAQSLRESGRGVSVSLTTVTDSARRAVSYFLRGLPSRYTSGG